jgi:DNA polymerase-3 subunit chi
MKITFLKVHDNQKKVQRLVEVIHHHFYKGDRILVVVPNAAAGKFIDDLLWSTPPESFLPHVMTEAPTAEQLVVTQKRENLNRSAVVINLTAGIWEESVDILYELMDRTSKDKEILSQNKINQYGADLVTIL